MKRTGIVLGNILLLSLAALPAQPPTWVCNAPGRKEFPSAGALVLRHEVKITLLPEGRTRKHVLLAYKVLRLPPVERSGIFDPRIHFDPSRQELKILQARTWLPSGRAVDTARNGKNLVFPGALNLCPDFSRFRDMVVTHVGVEEGCTIVLEYELTDKAGGRVPFEGVEKAQFPFPLLHQEFLLEVPKGTPLQAALLAPPQRLGEKTTKETPEGTRIRFFREGVIPRAAAPADLLVFGSRSWKDLERRFRSGLARLGRLPGNFLSALKKALSPPGSRLEKAYRAASLVKEGLRPVHWPPRLLGWSVRPAARIWESAYATPLEEGAFLAAALRAAGCKWARVVPVTRLSRLQVPCLEAAQEFWVAAGWEQGDPLWIRAGGLPGDPPPSTLLGASSLVGPRIPQDLWGTRGALQVKGSLVLGKQGSLSGNLLVTLEGTAFNGLEAARLGLGPQAGRLASRFGGAGAAEITVLELALSRARFRVTLKGGKVPPGPGGLLRLVLPLLPGSPASNLPGLENPRNPSETLLPGGPWSSELDLEIALPRGFRPFALPAGEEVRFPALGSLERKVEVEGGKIRLRRVLRLETGRIPPPRWKALRSLLLPLKNPASRTLLALPGKGKKSREIPQNGRR